MLLVFAHPDDETFYCSGTIIRLVRLGAKAQLIMATKGEAGSLGNPPLATKQALGKIRERELKKAAKIAGISKIYFLGFKDGTLQKVPLNKLSSKILSIITKEKPDLVFTFEKNGITLHPDHIAISKATTESFKRYMKTTKRHVRLYHACLPQSHWAKYLAAGYKYDFFGKMTGTPDHEITTFVNITDVYARKVKAVNCHETQKEDCRNHLKNQNLILGPKYEHFKLIAESNII